jgi:hypothetical protein
MPGGALRHADVAQRAQGRAMVPAPVWGPGYCRKANRDTEIRAKQITTNHNKHKRRKNLVVNCTWAMETWPWAWKKPCRFWHNDLEFFQKICPDGAQINGFFEKSVHMLKRALSSLSSSCLWKKSLDTILSA